MAAVVELTDRVRSTVMTKNTCLLVPFLLGVSVVARAQVAPDAGSLLQQIEKDRPLTLPKKAPPELRAAPPPLENISGPSVTVTRFRFEGNALLDEQALQAAVAPFLNRPLSFQELQRAALAVSNAYREAGWIARAYLPRQEVDRGTVKIQVIEAVFGGARAGGAEPTRVPMSRILPFIESAQPTGKPLNADALDRALLLIDDLPGVNASGNLAVGDRDNETVAVLKLTDEPLVSGDVGVDDTGARSTGISRLTTDFSFNSPLHLADAAAVNLIHSDGSDYQRAAYSLPLGSAGWRIGASVSHLDYHLVSRQFAALDAIGSSETAGLDLSYPLIRSRYRNLYFTANVDKRRFDNHAGGTLVSRYDVGSWTLGLNGNLFDGLGGGGASSAGLALEQGRLDLGHSPSRDTDATTTRTNGVFTKLHYGLSRQQTLTDTLSAFASLAGQQAGKNLDSSEKFYLGGNLGVRAYPTSEAGGTDGQLVNLELRQRLPHDFNVAGFYDWGHVKVNHRNDFVGAATVNSYSLKGVGLAAGWVATGGLALRATWARRLGSNPNPNADGSDQDGTLHKNRFWLTANLSF